MAEVIDTRQIMKLNDARMKAKDGPKPKGSDRALFYHNAIDLAIDGARIHLRWNLSHPVPIHR